jgi:TolB-like protein
VGIPRSERSGLAVLKFVDTTSHERASYFQSWEYGLAAMLITDLVQTEMFNIVDRVRLNVVLEEQELQTSGLVDPTTAVTIGKLIAAQYILTGTFMVVGEELKITAQVFSVEKGILLGASSVTGKTENFFLIEKDLFISVTKIMKIILDEEKQANIMRTFETKSVDASLENYSGEIAMMKADEMKKLGKEKESTMFKNDAKQKFKKALRYDPEYERAKQNFANLVKAIPMTL